MILFTGGCLPQCMLVYHPHGADTTHPPPHPGNRHPPSRHPPEQTPPRADTPRYGQRAGGMHPTGMQSCYRLQRSWAKVIFSQACVCPQGGRGVCLSACWDTPQEQTPLDQAHPPGADTPYPPEQTPPRTRQPPPGKQTAAYG